ncbi:mucin-2-like [Dermacentor albipictus]|uniref:mucin-2-like n=1 Tax=Dermacentor albipictus TaxID=60249 RepID=UPI0031FD663D
MDTTTCLTSVVLLLAALSATTVGQAETTTPTVTTTVTPMQKSSNNLLGPSSEERLLIQQGTTTAEPTDQTSDEPTTLPPSSETSSGTQTNNDIFGTENDKLNDIEADKLAKTEAHVEPESAVGAETPAVATNGTTTPTQVPATELEPNSADVFATIGSAEHSVPFHAEGKTVSSHIGGEDATSASSIVPVTSGTWPPDVATAADDSGVTTESRVNPEATSFAATTTPHALRETTSPGSFATQQAQAVPFSTDVLQQSSSVPSISGPQSAESSLETPTDGVYGGDPYFQPAISSPGIAAGPFHTPSLYSDPLNTNVPGYFNPTGTNGVTFPRFGLGFSRKRYSSPPEVVTVEQTLTPDSVDDTTPSPNIAPSEQGPAYGEASLPVTYGTTTESEATDSGASLPPSAADTTTEGITHAAPFLTSHDINSADSTSLSTEPPAQHANTGMQHRSELTSSTEKQHDEETPTTDPTPATNVHDGAPDVPTTESSLMPKPFINRAKMGRARTIEDPDPDSNDVTGQGPREMTQYTEPPVIGKNALQDSTSDPASPLATNSESTPSVSATEEPTTASPIESTATASVMSEPATVAPTGTVPSDITTSHTTGPIDLTQTSSESATGAPTESTMSTPVITTTFQDSGTPLQETTTTHLTAEGGTTSQTSDESVSQAPVEMTSSSPEEATSSSVTDATTESVTDLSKTAPTDSSTQSVSQSTGESGVSTNSTTVASGDSSTQYPDISVTQETIDVSTDTATTESHVSSQDVTPQVEASTDAASGHPELRTEDDFTTMTPAMTDGPANEGPPQTQTNPSVSGTTEVVQPVGKEELTTEGEGNMEGRTAILSEGTTPPATEQAVTTQGVQTTELPTYEATTPRSPVISNEDGESTPSSVYAATTPTADDRPAEFTTPTAETAATTEGRSTTPDVDSTTLTADTTAKPTADSATPAADTTESPVVETTAPPSAETTGPPTAETMAPPAAETTAPPPAETPAPPATDTTTPPATDTTTPPATDTTTPPAAETTAPPATETSARPAAEATSPPATETTAPPAAETTAPPAESTPLTAEILTHATETTTALSDVPETEPAVGEVATSPSAVGITTTEVSDVITTTAVEATTPANAPSTEPASDFGTASEVTGGSSASRSPKQLSESTSMSLPEWTTSPSTEHDHKHSFTTAPDLFSTTLSYTSWWQSSTHPPPSEEPAGRDITEGTSWHTDSTTASSIQDWTSSTEAPVYTSGSPTSTEIGADDASCNIVEGALPVSCLLPEELNQTVTVKFGDLNKTRAETFRVEARVWLLDYCNKNGIPLGDPTVVFLSGDRGMDLISFFVLNRTRGSVVPSDTVVAVLNNMKLTFEDKLGTAITDVFYGLPVIQKKDVGVAGFLGSSVGLIYVIVGAAVAALLLLALLVVIMVKCRTLSSNQYSPDSEKLTKDLHMRAEMGDLRPADEILKEEAQLKDALNGNGTHINGDGWVVPYSQIVNERKPPGDAQDTRL